MNPNEKMLYGKEYDDWRVGLNDDENQLEFEWDDEGETWGES